MIRVAGIASFGTGMAVGLCGVYAACYLARHGEIWYWHGYPGFGKGPFERLGIPTTVPLILGFAAVGLAQLFVGVALLAGWHPALGLSLVLIPFEFAYWYGFALPLGPLFTLARVVPTLVVLAHRT